MTREQIHIGNMSHETAIGILKLMLEAMETYDGISPTPERINAVKMAIKALEQEPFINKPCVSSGVCEHDKNKVLDKIRAEIIELRSRQNVGVMECLDILDKYKADREALADIYKPTLKADLCIMDEFAFMPQAESEK